MLSVAGPQGWAFHSPHRLSLQTAQAGPGTSHKGVPIIAMMGFPGWSTREPEGAPPPSSVFEGLAPAGYSEQTSVTPLGLSFPTL